MIALAASTLVWTFGFFLESGSGTLERQLFFNNIGYLGSMSVPVAWFVFALHYTSGRKLLAGLKTLPFCIVPIITLVLVWSNNWHHLMWSNEHLAISGPFMVTAKTYGPFFWVSLVYNYTLIIAGSIALVRRLFVGVPLYAGQAISLLVAVGLPLIWNAIYVFRLVPIPRKDLTPVMFTVSGVAVALGLMRFKLFAVIPFARRFLFQQLSDCVMVFDMRRRLVEANPAALTLLGISNNGIGERMEHITLLTPALEQISAGRFSRLELPLTITGNQRFYELQTIPMGDGQEQQVGWLIVMHDITEQKRAEEVLRESEGRFRNLAGELKHQNDQKTEFLHRIAHELKTPLTAIISSSELVATGDVSKISLPQTDQLLKNLNRSAWMMDTKINELIDFASVQMGGVKLQWEQLDLREIIDIASAQLSSMFKSKNQSLDAELSGTLPLVKGDRKRATDVILNLLSNAGKFSPTGGHIAVVAREQGNMVRVEVKDSALMIAEDERVRIFNPYYRDYSTPDQGQSGIGIGLAISKGLVTLMGGGIGVAGQEDHGNTFYFTLPIWTEEDKKP